MGDFDEYAYLEQAVEQQKEENGRAHGEEKGSEGHKERHKEKSSRHKESSSSKHKHRSRSRDRHRSSRSRHRSRSRERKHRTRTPEIRRERTPPEVREQRERERELQELDRDIRTLFAYNLNLKAEEKDIFDFFSKAGKIVDVRIIRDRNSGRSKGFAYIEFANREDIVNAMALTGQVLMGQAVMVKSSEAEKNLAWEAAQQQNAALAQMNALSAGSGSGPCKLYVGNLHAHIQEADLKQIFEPFGPVDFVTLQKDTSGRSQGYGFVQYKETSDAQKAMTQFDGMEIAGQKLSVKVAAMSAAEMQGALAGNADLDHQDDTGGLKLSSQTRSALMSRLAGEAPVLPPPPGPPGSGAPLVPAGPVMSAAAQALALEQGILGPSSPKPTFCLLLKNMFDPAKETEPEWDKDIAEDVKEECGKFGAVTHIHVDRNSKGYVYLKFASQEGAAAAQKALHGRWFAGNQVVAEFQFVHSYTSFFGV